MLEKMKEDESQRKTWLRHILIFIFIYAPGTYNK